MSPCHRGSRRALSRPSRLAKPSGPLGPGTSALGRSKNSSFWNIEKPSTRGRAGRGAHECRPFGSRASRRVPRTAAVVRTAQCAIPHPAAVRANRAAAEPVAHAATATVAAGGAVAFRLPLVLLVGLPIKLQQGPSLYVQLLRVFLKDLGITPV